MNIHRKHEARLIGKLTEKFYKNFRPGAPGECWNWIGAKQNGREYGRLAYGAHDGPNFYFEAAHRFSYRHFFGAIPDGMCVCHRCDNPKCVNPEHLFLGTHAENQADKAAKGRTARGEKHSDAVKAVTPRGSNNQSSVLRESDIPIILKMKASGNLNREIAERFGVSKSTITAIFGGRNWTHITNIPYRRPSRASI